MVITDGVHLISTSDEEELHDFAEVIELKRRWYQAHRKHPHYDLTTTKAMNRAIEKGARLTHPFDLVVLHWRKTGGDDSPTFTRQWSKEQAAQYRGFTMRAKQPS